MELQFDFSAQVDRCFQSSATNPNCLEVSAEGSDMQSAVHGLQNRATRCCSTVD